MRDGWLVDSSKQLFHLVPAPITMLKPNGNSVEVHPQLSHNRLPMDGVLVAVGSLDARPSFLSPIISSKTMASSFVLL